MLQTTFEEKEELKSLSRSWQYEASRYGCPPHIRNIAESIERVKHIIESTKVWPEREASDFIYGEVYSKEPIISALAYLKELVIFPPPDHLAQQGYLHHLKAGVDRHHLQNMRVYKNICECRPTEQTIQSLYLELRPSRQSYDDLLKWSGIKPVQATMNQLYERCLKDENLKIEDVLLLTESTGILPKESIVDQLYRTLLASTQKIEYLLILEKIAKRGFSRYHQEIENFYRRALLTENYPVEACSKLNALTKVLPEHDLVQETYVHFMTKGRSHNESAGLRRFTHIDPTPHTIQQGYMRGRMPKEVLSEKEIEPSKPTQKEMRKQFVNGFKYKDGTIPTEAEKETLHDILQRSQNLEIQDQQSQSKELSEVEKEAHDDIVLRIKNLEL